MLPSMSVSTRPFARVLLSLVVLGAPSLAVAADDLSARPPRGTYVWVSQDATASPTPRAEGESHVLYLNRCEGGETITAGWPDDNTINRSGILSGTVDFPPFPFGDDAWEQVVQHTRQIYAPFDVLVTDVDPSPMPHDEALVCGSGSLAGFSGAGGVAPFSCGVIDKSITFTFPESLGNDPRTIAEVIAQEAAHAWGLEHEHKCEDPMTYLSGCGDKTYQDGDYPCGEYSPRSCECGGQTQNSYQYIMGLFGPAVPDVADPSATIVAPHDGDAFAIGEPVDIVVQVDDDIGVTHVALFLDGELATEALAAPFGPWRASDLPEGAHELTIEASDGAGKTTLSPVVTVSITADGQPPAGGSGGDGSGSDGGGDDGPAGDGGADGDVDDGWGDSPALPPGFGADGMEAGCACNGTGGTGSDASWVLLGLLGLGRSLRRRRDR